jgi:hypothetical protein
VPSILKAILRQGAFEHNCFSDQSFGDGSASPQTNRKCSAETGSFFTGEGLVNIAKGLGAVIGLLLAGTSTCTGSNTRLGWLHRCSDTLAPGTWNWQLVAVGCGECSSAGFAQLGAMARQTICDCCIRHRRVFAE